jgi:hypothetical protein
MKKDKGIWVFDIEQLINFHSIVLINVHTLEKIIFIIHYSKNDILEYISFLKKRVKGMIGFNNVNYDYPIIHFILTDVINICNRNQSYDDPDFINSLLYEKSKKVINSNSSFPSIPSWDVIIPQCDLFRIHHFNNKNKSTSLKQVEFVLRLKNVEDMPIHHSAYIREEDINSIINYNINDVIATLELYKLTYNDIQLRKEISKEYDINCLNYDDAKIGQEIMIKEISNFTGEEIKSIKEKRTVRNGINLNDCILKSINFKSKQFSSLLKWLKEKHIYSTKGPFSNIDIKVLDYLLPFMNKKMIKGKIKNLNILYKGFQFDFGVGGIHGCIKSGIYEKDNNYSIIDIDVASYYPNLAIINNFYPEHLSSFFCNIYKSVYDKRKKSKKISKDKSVDNITRVLHHLIQSVLKLALNGVFGKSNSEFSPFYDTQYTMKTTLNGQLLLCMLAERLLDNIDDIQLLQINTDGLTVKINNNYIEDMHNYCKKWEKYTKLELEYCEYKKMIIGDVNNYLAIKDKNENELECEQPESTWYNNNYTKQKTKGRFEVVKTQNGKIALNKNWSQICVTKAIYDYYVYNNEVKNSLMNNKDIFDFCKMFKCSQGWKTIYVDNKGNKITLSKTTRYYMSINGGKLLKVHNDGRQQMVEAKGRVTIFNKYEDKNFKDYNIDYSYYINECNKIIFDINNNGQKELF